ncbi:hypothetical protein LTR10_000051 [Elasticomyces elasticus]|nr:hypothetical protein LTR10_000051 [Elasticomyces elasticus]KAK4980690.1 hypothetical protein LTR42_000999 [Elasticomyces elasticus]
MLEHILVLVSSLRVYDFHIEVANIETSLMPAASNALAFTASAWQAQSTISTPSIQLWNRKMSTAAILGTGGYGATDDSASDAMLTCQRTGYQVM